MNIKTIILSACIAVPPYVILSFAGCSNAKEVQTDMRNVYTVTEYVCRHNHGTDKDKLFEAFCFVESSHKADAVNKTSGATGVVQIMPIMIKEANRLLGREKYKLSDRYDKKKSEEIFHLIMSKKNPNYDLAKACYIWNPNGKTDYTNKVEQRYKELIKCNRQG